MRRKPMMIDADLVEAVKEIANKHGMTLAAYMRSLLANLVEAENRGLFAPLALRKALLLSKLRSAGLALLPINVVNTCELASHELEKEGERIGVLLRNLGIRIEDALDIFIEDLKTAIREKDKIIIVASSNTDKALKEFLKGLAKAYKASIREEGDVLVISVGEPG